MTSSSTFRAPSRALVRHIHIRLYDHPLTASSIERVTGYVVCANHPSDFYFSPDKWDDRFYAIEKNMKPDKMVSKQRLENPEIGDACLVQFAEKGYGRQWLRAEVIKVSGSEATVLFVDYGNQSKVQKTNLIQMDREELSKDPKLAVRCKLDGIAPKEGAEWSKAAQRCFSKFTAEKSNLKKLTATVLSHSEGAFVFQLKDEKGNSIVEKLTKEAHAKRVSVVVICKYCKQKFDTDKTEENRQNFQSHIVSNYFVRYLLVVFKS